jgi:hypothetical protein
LEPFKTTKHGLIVYLGIYLFTFSRPAQVSRPDLGYVAEITVPPLTGNPLLGHDLGQREPRDEWQDDQLRGGRRSVASVSTASPHDREKMVYLGLQTLRFADLGLQTSTWQKWVSKRCTFDFLAIMRISSLF